MIGRSWELVEVRVEGSARSRVVRGDDPDTLVVVDLDGGEGLSATFDRAMPSGMQHHTRSSVLTRLVMHDSFHCGEVSTILSRNGLESMDPWEPIPVEPA